MTPQNVNRALNENALPPGVQLSAIVDSLARDGNAPGPGYDTSAISDISSPSIEGNSETSLHADAPMIRHDGARVVSSHQGT